MDFLIFSTTRRQSSCQLGRGFSASVTTPSFCTRAKQVFQISFMHRMKKTQPIEYAVTNGSAPVTRENITFRLCLRVYADRRLFFFVENGERCACVCLGICRRQRRLPRVSLLEGTSQTGFLSVFVCSSIFHLHLMLRETVLALSLSSYHFVCFQSGNLFSKHQRQKEGDKVPHRFLLTLVPCSLFWKNTRC